ncbi:MAG TPA: hypothetical protein VFH66_11935 [Mycobacteriales bacterium]|nr:hypothetical protein [Mycobacteriales bacterium]
MRRAYHVLAYLIAVEVVVQAMMMATAVAGLDHWIHDGATVDKKVIDSHPSFNGSFGFPVHAINGEMLIPLLALALLVVSFFAGVVGGTRWALYVLGLIVVQVVLGVTQGNVPLLGLLHGANALAIFAIAVVTAHRAKSQATGVGLGTSTAV